MGAKIPKQYLKIMGREIGFRSLDVLMTCDDIDEVVVVCAEEWTSAFQDHVAAVHADAKKEVKYTTGGGSRQGSMKNGLACATSEFAAVHDAARPLVTVEEVKKVIADAKECGAALLAVPTKATIKWAKPGTNVVESTPDRKLLWEAHTPQVVKVETLKRGFKLADEKDLEVTDDVSLVEALGEEVKITEGEYTNIKVTTPEDMGVAEGILRARGEEDD